MPGTCNLPCEDLNIIEQDINGKTEKVCEICGKIIPPEAIELSKKLKQSGIL